MNTNYHRFLPLLLGIVMLVSSSLNCNAQRNKQKKKNLTIVTESQVMDYIDSLYNSTIVIQSLTSSFDQAKNDITDYINKLPNIIKQKVCDNYYTMFLNACEKDDNSLAQEHGLKCLLLDVKPDIIIYEVLITIDGDKGNVSNLNYLLNKLEALSVISSNTQYEDKSKELREKYEDVLHPKTMEEIISGKWISLDHFPQLNNYNSLSEQFPSFIIDISSVRRNNGATFISAPTIFYEAKKSNNHWFHKQCQNQVAISQSLFFDGINKVASARFASEKIKEAQTEIAMQGYEDARKSEAELNAQIWSDKKANFGEKVAGTALVSLTTSLTESFFDALAVGSKQVEAYAFDFFSPTSKRMNALVSYENVKVKSTGVQETKNRVDSHPVQFAKWEESDSVVFITHNGKPIFVEQSLANDSPLLKEYYDVRKKYSFWHPRYYIPAAIGVGIGVYCIVRGVSFMIDADKKENEQEKKRLNNKGLIIYCVGGGIIGGTLGYILGSRIPLQRAKAYDEINKKSMNKMRNKGASLSLQPSVNPIDNSYGIHANLTW